MRNAESVEAAYRRTRLPKALKSKSARDGSERGGEPMDIGNIELKKHAPAKREK